VVGAQVLGLLLRFGGLGAGSSGSIVPGGNLDRVIRHPLDVARVATGCRGAAGAQLPAGRRIKAKEVGQQLGSTPLGCIAFAFLRVAHVALSCGG
jgi:hypothetical protein